jgi:hypothetical protein
MALFRFHRGSLDTSLATTIIIKNKNELFKAIRNYLSISYLQQPTIKLKIEPHPSKESNFDHRIGWYTHIVTVSWENQKKFPIGFLSEPLNEN